MNSPQTNKTPVNDLLKRTTIGIFTNTTIYGAGSYQTAIFQGASDAAEEKGINLIVFGGRELNSPLANYGHCNAVYDLATPATIDALIFCTGPMMNYVTIDEFSAFANRYDVPRISLGVALPQAFNILVDNMSGMRKVIRHLIEVHHYHRIAFICGPDANAEAARRLQAYRDTLAEYHIPFDPQLVVPGNFIPQSGMDAVHTLLDKRQVTFDAIVGANDQMAIGAVLALKEREIDVPGQIAVVGFDDAVDAEFLTPPLTTVRQPLYEQGRSAVELAVALLSGKNVGDLTLETELVVRRSCGCLPKSMVTLNDFTPPPHPISEETIRSALATIDWESLLAGQWVTGALAVLQQLYEAFLSDLESADKTGEFISTLERLIEETVQQGISIEHWHDILSTLRHHVLPIVSSNIPLLTRAESLWQQGRMVIGQAGRQIEAHNWVQFKYQLATLDEIGQVLSPLALDLSVLRQHLPVLGIKLCYIMLYDDPSREWSRLLFAYDQSNLDNCAKITDEQPRFLSKDLVPPGLMPSDRNLQFLVEALYPKDEHLGYFILEVGSLRTYIYQAFFAQVSSGLHAASLVQQLVQKSREREDFNQRLAHRTEQLNTIMRMGQVAITYLDLQSLLERVVEEVQVALNYDVVAIYLLDADNNTLIQRAAVGMVAFELLETTKHQKIPYDASSLISTVARSHQLINDGHIGHKLSYRTYPQFNVQSEVGIPLLVDGGNRLIGVLDIQSYRPEAFSTDDVEILGILANQIAIAIHNAELFNASEKARQNAHEAQKLAEEANKAKSIFLANMSHELRTPLNAILGFAQLLGRNRALDPSQRENVDIILRSGEHLLGLINDVLEMSKIEAGQMTLNEVDFDYYLMLQAMENMFRIRAEQKDLTLQFERASNVPQFIHSDEGKLRQVLINLLGNAIKFTNRGSVILRTYFQTEAAQPDARQRLFIEIEDTGQGISPEEMTAIFEPFVQSANTQKVQEGTGLGLPISRRFVELMGGTLSAESIANQKTIFRFDVQVSTTTFSTVQSYQNAGRVVGLEAGQRVFRILVVEDNWENRNWLIKLLTTVGFEVREATNGDEAIKLWHYWKPDLILMDMRMPMMDGYSATRHIKADPDGANVIIFALTASAFDQDRNMALTAGCNDFLAKPFRESSIFEKIEQYLHVRFIRETVVHESAQISSTELSSASLAALPADMIMKLDAAALRADSKRLKELIEQIRTQDQGLANGLTELVKAYRVDKIRALTQAIKSAGQSSQDT